MIDKEVDFSELIFGEGAENIKNTLQDYKNNRIKENNMIVKRNPPRCKRTTKKELNKKDVIKIINEYCSGNLKGKERFTSWLTKNSQDIKNNGLLSITYLKKKLNKSEESLNKKESYHIQTFNEMFND